jgi:hypothetical protein
MAEQMSTAPLDTAIATETGSEITFAPLESEILLYLYNHPAGNHETASLAFHLRAPNLPPDELPRFDEKYTQKQQEDILAVQHAVETLILAQCVEGTRAELGSTIQFTAIKLTQIGEAEAIKVKRNLKELTAEGQ